MRNNLSKWWVTFFSFATLLLVQACESTYTVIKPSVSTLRRNAFQDITADKVADLMIDGAASSTDGGVGISEIRDLFNRVKKLTPIYYKRYKGGVKGSGITFVDRENKVLQSSELLFFKRYLKNDDVAYYLFLTPVNTTDESKKKFYNYFRIPEDFFEDINRQLKAVDDTALGISIYF